MGNAREQENVGRIVKLSLSFFLLCPLAGAQAVTFGVKGGGILTEPAESYDQSRRYIIGPYFEVRLPAHFAVEGGALYSRFGSSLPTNRGDLWQFPILGKYYVTSWPHGGLHPFLSAGIAARKIWLDNSRAVRPGDFSGGYFRRNSDTQGGAAFGGGVDFRVRHLGLAPEFRYMRWEGRDFPATNANEAQILLGIHF